jgi:chaperonin cofactor prefoldin
LEEIEKSADDEQLFELVGQILISKGKKELSSALKEKNGDIGI